MASLILPQRGPVEEWRELCPLWVGEFLSRSRLLTRLTGNRWLYSETAVEASVTETGHCVVSVFLVGNMAARPRLAIGLQQRLRPSDCFFPAREAAESTGSTRPEERGM